MPGRNETHHEQDGSSFDKVAFETILDDPPRRMHIQRGKNIIQQNNVRIGVNRSCQCYASLEVTTLAIEPTRRKSTYLLTSTADSKVSIKII